MFKIASIIAINCICGIGLLAEVNDRYEPFPVIIMGMMGFISLSMLKHMFNDKKHTSAPVSEALCSERVKNVMAEIKHGQEMTKLLLEANGITPPPKETSND